MNLRKKLSVIFCVSLFCFFCISMQKSYATSYLWHIRISGEKPVYLVANSYHDAEGEYLEVKGDNLKVLKNLRLIDQLYLETANKIWIDSNSRLFTKKIQTKKKVWTIKTESSAGGGSYIIERFSTTWAGKQKREDYLTETPTKPVGDLVALVHYICTNSAKQDFVYDLILKPKGRTLCSVELKGNVYQVFRGTEPTPIIRIHLDSLGKPDKLIFSGTLNNSRDLQVDIHRYTSNIDVRKVHHDLSARELAQFIGKPSSASGTPVQDYQVKFEKYKSNFWLTYVDFFAYWITEKVSNIVKTIVERRLISRLSEFPPNVNDLITRDNIQFTYSANIGVNANVTMDEIKKLIPAPQEALAPRLKTRLDDKGKRSFYYLYSKKVQVREDDVTGIINKKGYLVMSPVKVSLFDTNKLRCEFISPMKL